MQFLIDNFDSIVKVAILSFGAFGFFLALRNDIISLKGDIGHIKENQKALAEAFTQLGNILTKVAVQDVRLQMMEKRIDELSHGKGYVDS
jgi:hypothetical protein